MCMESDRALRARDFVNQFSEHNAKTVRECVTKYPAILAQEDFCACMGEQMVQKYRDNTGPPTSSAPTSRASRSRTRSRTGPTQCSSSGSTQRCTMPEVRPDAGRAQRNACRLCRNRGEPAVPRGIGAALAGGRVARSCRNLRCQRGSREPSAGAEHAHRRGRALQSVKKTRQYASRGTWPGEDAPAASSAKGCTTRGAQSKRLSRRSDLEVRLPG